MIDVVDLDRADVYVAGKQAATLARDGRRVTFAYTDAWVRSGGRAVATTLPVTADPVVSDGGAVPPFFAGLLPEGRRLSALRRAVKTSVDDELSLLLAVGSDPVGDVQVVPAGADPVRATARVTTGDADFSGVAFRDLLASYDIEVDRVGLAGVQDKASLTMLSVPVSGTTGEYVLKLDPPEYPHIVENEAYFVAAARHARVEAVRATVVVDADGTKGLAVERFDRVTAGGSVEARAVEDGCQVLGFHPEAKYRVSTEEVISALAGVCTAPIPAAMTFFRQVVFAYVSGNGDAHAKNFSVVADGSGGFRPAPAYDLPCTVLYGDATMALRIDGRRDGNITRRRFLALAAAVGIREPAAARAIDDVARSVDVWIDGIAALPFDVGRIRKITRVLRNRQRLLTE